MKVFEIIEEYRALEVLMNEVNEETGEFVNSEDDIKEYIEKLNEDKLTKLDNIERLKREIEGQKYTLDKEIKRLQNLKKKKDNNIKNLIDLQMYLTGGEKIEAPLYKFGTRKSKSVQITDLDQIPDKFCTFEKKPNKKDIKEEIERMTSRGESFFGAEIVEKTSLTVK